MLQETPEEQESRWHRYFNVEDLVTQKENVYGHKFGRFLASDGIGASIKMTRSKVIPSHPTGAHRAIVPFHILRKTFAFKKDLFTIGYRQCFHSQYKLSVESLCHVDTIASKSEEAMLFFCILPLAVRVSLHQKRLQMAFDSDAGLYQNRKPAREVCFASNCCPHE